MDELQANRDLTAGERTLIRWMLEHGEPEARDFLPQLDRLKILPTRCPCGCATIEFSLDGEPRAEGDWNIIADFLFGGDSDLCGTFLVAQGGKLSFLEVYGLAVDAPKTLPSPEALREIPDGFFKR